MADSPGDVTRLLQQWAAGDASALDHVLPLVYRELRKIAKRYMRRENLDHTLQSTAVVHEAYLKLVGASDRNWGSRAHFFAVAAKAMRQVLVDHARSAVTKKRGGQVRMLELEQGLAVVSGR